MPTGISVAVARMARADWFSKRDEQEPTQEGLLWARGGPCDHRQPPRAPRRPGSRVLPDRPPQGGAARCQVGVGRPPGPDTDDPRHEERRPRGDSPRGRAGGHHRAALARPRGPAARRRHLPLALDLPPPWQAGPEVRGRVPQRTVAAGVPHKIVHDFRRTALRDLVRVGVNQHVAMQITGHRSPEVFRRYDIVDERDMRQAHRQVAVYPETRTETDNSKVVRL